MKDAQQDTELNPNTLSRVAQDTALWIKEHLEQTSQQAKAAATVCKDKTKAAATVCQDKAKVAATVCQDKAKAAATVCQDKAKVVYAVCKAKAEVVIAAVYTDKTKAILAQCKSKAQVVYTVCKDKAQVVYAVCKAKAKVLVAAVYTDKTKALLAQYREKANAIAAICRDKARVAVILCQDAVLQAWMKGCALARTYWEKASVALRKLWDKTCAYACQLWENAGVFASKVRVRVDRHPISPLLYITLLSVGIGAIAFNGSYTKAYVAYVDGQEVGVVSSEEELSSIVGNVENRVASVLGQDYSYDTEITLAPTYLDAGTQTNARAIEDALFEDTGAMMDAYALSVDGQELGYAQTSEELEQLLAQVVQPYLTEQTVEHSFLQTVEIFPVELPSNTEFALDTLLATLTSNKEEAQYISVERGDTYNKIAERVGITTEQLQALNPNVDSSKLVVGDQLLVKQAVPTLTVQTVVTQTYEETIQSPVEYVDNANLYKGTTQLMQEGQDGVQQVEARVTLVNGVETQREEVSRTTIQEVTTTYMYQGTKEKPATASTGNFIWPLRGTITSRFGYRYIFGSTSFHSGLDIAAPYGTQISAADGGTVTFAGWKNSYGYTVVITHDNGMVTYYAHCSSLLVSAGDKVYQGQAIARVGMTGTATGNHCHFEVRVGGKSVNPENYL